MNTLRRYFVLLFAVLSLGACATATPIPQESPTTEDQIQDNTPRSAIRIDNDSFELLYVSLSATRGDSPAVMRPVGGHQTKLFVFPWPAAQDIRVEIKVVSKPGTDHGPLTCSETVLLPSGKIFTFKIQDPPIYSPICADENRRQQLIG